MKKIFFILPVLTMFFSACKKNIDQVPEEEVTSVKVENGYLAFADKNAYADFSKKQMSLTSEARRAVEKKLNFTSLASLFEDVKEKIDAVENEDEKKLIVEGYKDVFKYDEKGLGFKNDNDQIAIAINRGGYYKMGTALYKSIDNFLIIATTTDYSQLERIHSTEDYVNLASNDVKIGRFPTKEDFLQYVASKNVSRISSGGPYSAGTNYHYLLSVRNESNNRRFFVDLVLRNEYAPEYTNGTYSGFFSRYVYTLTFGHQKKGTFGWNSYVSPTYIQLLETRLRNVVWPNTTLTWAGTLDNGSSQQQFIGMYFGVWSPWFSHTEAEAATWVELTGAQWTMTITATGNGQILYTNQYL